MRRKNRQTKIQSNVLAALTVIGPVVPDVIEVPEIISVAVSEQTNINDSGQQEVSDKPGSLVEYYQLNNDQIVEQISLDIVENIQGSSNSLDDLVFLIYDYIMLDGLNVSNLKKWSHFIKKYLSNWECKSSSFHFAKDMAEFIKLYKVPVKKDSMPALRLICRQPKSKREKLWINAVEKSTLNPPPLDFIKDEIDEGKKAVKDASEHVNTADEVEDSSIILVDQQETNVDEEFSTTPNDTSITDGNTPCDGNGLNTIETKDENISTPNKYENTLAKQYASVEFAKLCKSLKTDSPETFKDMLDTIVLRVSSIEDDAFGLGGVYKKILENLKALTEQHILECSL